MLQSINTAYGKAQRSSILKIYCTFSTLEVSADGRPCITHWHNLLIITNYSQQDANFLEFIYFWRRSTCFTRFLRPSSGAHNCTCSFRYCQLILLLAPTVVAASSSIGWQYLKLYVQLCAPDDGGRNPPETCRAFVKINKTRNVASCRL